MFHDNWAYFQDTEGWLCFDDAFETSCCIYESNGARDVSLSHVDL